MEMFNKLFIIFISLIFKINCFNDLHDFSGVYSFKLDLFKNLYLKNKTDVKKHDSIFLIPKKIHQVWIGPNTLPEKFKWMSQTIKKLHPHWEYKLWTNDDLKDFNFKNFDIFQKVNNIGAKVDILRYEILERYGGVYIDIDFELLKSLDDLNMHYNFYACLLCGTDTVANGLIASIPGHSILKACIEKIAQITIFDNYGDNTFILNLTGPNFFTNVIINYLNKNKHDKRIIIFPSCFFFPFPATLRESFWQNEIQREQILNFIKPETYGIHYWATSWQ